MSGARVGDSDRQAAKRPGWRPIAVAGACGIVGVAAALRLWHISAGVPYAVGPDEPQIMQRVAVMMKTGDFNPHFFDWPTLTFYLHLIVACVTFLGGSMRGLWSHLDQVGAPELYLGGRVFTAVLGTATVAMTIAAARRFGIVAALIAGAVMAVVPGHVRESHYVLTDVPTAFFTTLTLWLSLRALDTPAFARVLWAAAAAGLAGSCKYNGLIAIVMPMVVVWAAGGGIRTLVTRTVAVVAVTLAAFLSGTPYAILDLPTFLNHYARLAAAFANAPILESGWTVYPKHILGAMGWPGVIASLAGLVLALGRAIAGPGRARAWLLISFAVLYFMVMARGHQIYARYLLPLYPFLAVGCGLTVSAVVNRLRAGRLPRAWALSASVAVAVLVLAMPTAGAVSLIRQFGSPSTVGLAYGWLLGNIPPGSTVAVEAGVLQLPNAYVTMATRSFVGRSYDDYVADGVTYFLAASQEFQATLTDAAGHRDAFVAYRTLFSRAVLVAAFDPMPTVSGPSLRIYRVER